MTNANRAAQYDRAVCFCCDDTYLPYALFAALQIHRMHRHRTFDLVIASPTPCAVPDDFPDIGLRLVQIDTARSFDKFGFDARRSESMYLRLSLPAALGEAYKRILYLDSDIFLLRDGIDRLLKADMHGRAVAAVRDNIQWRTPTRRPREYKQFGWPSEPYFNSGVLLIDCASFADQQVLEDAVRFGTSHCDHLLRHDQTLLNAVLRNKWAEMSPRWNWQFTWASKLFALTEDARLLHFIGPKKPWQPHDGVFPSFISRVYAEFLAEHYGTEAPEHVGKTLVFNDKTMTKSLIKHALSRRKMAAYLERFPDDMVLKAPPLPH